MSDERIRVLCVDDHAFLVEGLRTRLTLEPDLEFVGWLSSARELLAETERLAPHIILLDIEMPAPDPFEVLQDVNRRFKNVRVIMLSAYVRDHYIDLAFKAGAWGYLSKSDAPDAVVAAIRKVHQGEFAFGAKVLERCHGLAADGTQPARLTSKLDLLTPRELQVLRMIGKGLSRIEIAHAIHRSPKTVDNHRAAIMEKLGIHDRVELARYALSEGLTEL
ncbi:MAG: response regulator transcription factor [Planctomycetota bacterium]